MAPHIVAVVTGALAVRQATVVDAVAIAEVHVASWRGAYAGLLPQALLDSLSVSQRAESWQKQLSDPVQTTFIASVGEQMVGFASVGPSRDDDGEATGELHAIYVLPEHWGGPAGHTLHGAATAVLADTYREATLWVLEANDRARSFYERAGWLPDGARKLATRGEATLNEIRYRRSLANLQESAGSAPF